MEDICNCLHEDVVKSKKENILNDEVITDMADFFKVFSDSTRLKIINALIDTELCVCDIASIVESSPSAVSHQLRLLRQTKLIKFKKVGKVVYYSLDDDHIKEIFEKGHEHINEM